MSGAQTDAALVNMSMFGLILACGAIAGLNKEDEGIVRVSTRFCIKLNHDTYSFPPVQHFEKIFERYLTVQGFLFRTGPDAERAFNEFDQEVFPLLQAGKIQNREHRFIGLQNSEKALLAVHTGENFGKAVIIVDEEGGEA